MDLFGQALQDYMNGETDGVMEVSTNISDEELLPVSYFFRGVEKMPVWETLVLSGCGGKVLDVGACAGSHALHLQERGMDVTALDISPGAVQVMNQRGVKDARCGDIMHFKGTGYDNMLFLMNGIGMAGKLSKLKDFLLYVKKMLSQDGTIYIESTDLIYMYEEEDGSVLLPFGHRYYGDLMYEIRYKGLIQPPFPWLYVDIDNLSEVAGRAGLHMEVIFQGETHNYVAALSPVRTFIAG